MRILVVGAGGVGGYFAARLARSGADLTVAARGEHGRLLRERGLTIETGGQSETVALPKVAPAERLTPHFDVVFVAVKWSALERACDELPRLLAPSGVVVPLLNGL